MDKKPCPAPNSSKKATVAVCYKLHLKYYWMQIKWPFTLRASYDAPVPSSVVFRLLQQQKMNVTFVLLVLWVVPPPYGMWQYHDIGKLVTNTTFRLSSTPKDGNPFALSHCHIHIRSAWCERLRFVLRGVTTTCRWSIPYASAIYTARFTMPALLSRLLLH